jgi:hypothetical protein
VLCQRQKAQRGRYGYNDAAASQVDFDQRSSSGSRLDPEFTSPYADARQFARLRPHEVRLIGIGATVPKTAAANCKNNRVGILASVAKYQRTTRSIAYGKGV